MSILSEWLYSLRQLLFPQRCAVCGTLLAPNEQSVCTCCRVTAPMTGYWNETANPLWLRLREQFPVEQASAFLFFTPSGGWRRMIHGFKYRGSWRTAYTMGRWYGRRLKESGLYRDVDCVVPLPLHPLKRILRGYNQSEYLADGIAEQLGVRVDRRSLFRKRYTAAQARKQHRDRARNVAGAFAVRHAGRLSGCHVLLVDDVMTTGSTLLSCAESLRQQVPDCRISIAVLAVVRRNLGVME